MLVRTIPAKTPVTLTSENHPENAELKEKPTTVTLASSVFIGALCSLIGMTIGSAALSTAQQSDRITEVIFLIPLVATTASLLGGWTGAFFYLVRSDASKSKP